MSCDDSTSAARPVLHPVANTSDILPTFITASLGEAGMTLGEEHEIGAMHATRSTTRAHRNEDDAPPNHDGSPQNKWSPIDAEVMILSRIDDRAYKRALLVDSNNILLNYIFPISFPWHEPRAPLIRTLPRDIEEMHGIFHAEDETVRPFGSNGGTFGYGRFESGWHRKGTTAQVRCGELNGLEYENALAEKHVISNSVLTAEHECTREEGDSAATGSNGLFAYHDKMRAAARRSDDPGIIELTIILPPPPNIESALLNCQKFKLLPNESSLRHDPDSLRRVTSLVDAERAEFSSCMPLHWQIHDKQPFFNPPAFVREHHDATSEQDTDDDSPLVDDKLKRRLIENQERQKRKRVDLAMSCTRKWFISVKVDNVSSRKSIILGRPSLNVRECEVDCNESPLRNCAKKPILGIATFPLSIQTGKPTTIEVASKMNELSSRLGTYDCRASAMDASIPYQATNLGNGTKKESSGRSKRVIVGRNRLIWTGMKTSHNDMSALVSSHQRKITFSSLLTGQKLDAATYKRPREARVTVRLSGRLLTEAEEDCDTAVLSHASSKESDNFSPFVYNLNNVYQQSSVRVKNDETIYLDHETQSDENVDDPGCESDSSHFTDDNCPHHSSNATCDLDRQALLNDIIKNLMPQKILSSKKKSAKHSTGGNPKLDSEDTPSANIERDVRLFVPMKYGGSNILKHVPPTFSSLPLEDGYIRVICESPGAMQGSSVHQLLNLAARKDSSGEAFCSVCWTGDGDDNQSKVQECGNCGLLAHLHCCFDEGDFLFESENSYLPTNGLKVDGNSSDESGFSSQSSNSVDDSLTYKRASFTKWRCAICRDTPKHPEPLSTVEKQDTIAVSSRKSQRSARIPSRFTENQESLFSHLHLKRSLKTRPSPKCTLCPHSGGAMSVLDRGEGDNTVAKRWTHEVCRIWCSEMIFSTHILLTSGSVVAEAGSRTPFVCPTAKVCALCGMGELHNIGREKEEILACGVIPRTEGNVASNPDACKNVPGLIKCAARGCHVVFHPLCALLTTKLQLDEVDTIQNCRVGKGQLNKNRNDDAKAMEEISARKELDKGLCSKYTLQLVKLIRTEGTFGCLPGHEKVNIVPIAFCGLHNPRRERSLYGCPLWGDMLSGAMRIPAYKY